MLLTLIQGNQGVGWFEFQDECLQSINIAAEFKVHVEVLTECYHGVQILYTLHVPAKGVWGTSPETF